MEKQDNGEIRANEAGQEADEAVRAAGAPRRGMDRRPLQELSLIHI